MVAAAAAALAYVRGDSVWRSVGFRGGWLAMAVVVGVFGVFVVFGVRVVVVATSLCSSFSRPAAASVMRKTDTYTCLIERPRFITFACVLCGHTVPVPTLVRERGSDR